MKAYIMKHFNGRTAIILERSYAEAMKLANWSPRHVTLIEAVEVDKFLANERHFQPTRKYTTRPYQNKGVKHGSISK